MKAKKCLDFSTEEFGGLLGFAREDGTRFAENGGAPEFVWYKILL